MFLWFVSFFKVVFSLSRLSSIAGRSNLSTDLFFLISRFEAKPVETSKDYELYDQLNFQSDDFDADFDDDNYCKYIIPAEDTTEGKIFSQLTFDYIFYVQ